MTNINIHSPGEKRQRERNATETSECLDFLDLPGKLDTSDLPANAERLVYRQAQYLAHERGCALRDLTLGQLVYCVGSVRDIRQRGVA